jgi:hypothetical protein
MIRFCTRSLLTMAALIAMTSGCLHLNDQLPGADSGTDPARAGSGGKQGGGAGGAKGSQADSAADAPTQAGGSNAGDDLIKCPAGQHACDGTCVSDDSPQTCGVSCSPCPAPSGGTAACDGLKCTATCPTGQTLCSGECIESGKACDRMCGSGTHHCNGLCLENNSVNACGAACEPCKPPPGGRATCDGSKCAFTCDAGKICGDRCGECCESVDCVKKDGFVASCDGATLRCKYSCPAGQKECNGTCVATDACCANTDCPMKDGQVGKCDQSSHQCQWSCAGTTKPCGGSCIQESGCCDDKGCTGSFACVNNSCSNSTCQSGFKLCNGACIGQSRCCDDNECGANKACKNGTCVTTCTPGGACSLTGRPCRAGRIACENGSPVCVDSGPDDGKGGCASGNHCSNGACAADCVGGVSCTGNPGPCRKGQIACPSGACVDSNQAANEGGGCAGSNICKGGQCVAPCKSGDSCTDGVTACHRGTTVCDSQSSNPRCQVSVDDSKGGCGGGQTCTNGACVQTCKADQPCSDGVGQCEKGLTTCASSTAKPGCRVVTDNTKSCNGGFCEGGRCVACGGAIGDPCCKSGTPCKGKLLCNRFDNKCTDCGGPAGPCCGGQFTTSNGGAEKSGSCDASMGTQFQCMNLTGGWFCFD